jgi:hypothetical protein
MDDGNEKLLLKVKSELKITDASSLPVIIVIKKSEIIYFLGIQN